MKVRSEGWVKSAYPAIGINLEGIKDVLGIWIEQTEGAKFWLKIMTGIKNRGAGIFSSPALTGSRGSHLPSGRSATVSST